MDFLDPKKERLSRIQLLLGYCLVALAIGIATLVLLYQSYGFYITKGQITQNGLLFVSSQPSGAVIKLNGVRYKSNTNSRVTIPTGAYLLQLTRDGYRPWERPVVVNGGDVQHFDYPFLFPKQLETTNLNDLIASPSVATQSLDKRWLLLGETNSSGNFEEYDLKDPAKPALHEIGLPNGSFTPGDGTTADTWSTVEWASDNRHLLLLHGYTIGQTTAHEYVLLDRDSPIDSIDLTTALHLTQDDAVSLYDNRTDQFYIYSQSAQTLQRVNGSDGSLVSQLDHILAFKTYGSNYVLYVTAKSPAGKTVEGQVSAVLQVGQKTITLRTLPASAPVYMLNLAQYGGDWYVAVGASNDTAAYIYKNPQDQAVPSVDAFPAPWRRLLVANPSFLAFSSNAQFLVAENGQNFMVYDFENVAAYRYQAKEPIDGPQGHAVWMDGDRLLYVSGGKLTVFDYDYRNRQTLEAADSNYASFFAPDFSYAYTLRSATATTKAVLTSTPLVVLR
ncbi:MAG TPA: PEGA domain-containing protein [Candidatus Saccharimonadales bacterium]|nr:PEGA domain-containing protein [Candidatus Saccharimonadales bacterium]